MRLDVQISVSGDLQSTQGADPHGIGQAIHNGCEYQGQDRTVISMLEDIRNGLSLRHDRNATR